jgi:hypothetical protein
MCKRKFKLQDTDINNLKLGLPEVKIGLGLVKHLLEDSLK